MPRLNVTNIGRPPHAYRIDLTPEAKFESAAASREEDLFRAKQLRSVQLPTTELKAQALDLARRLERRSVPETLASSRYMREQRIDLTGAVWELVDQARKGNARVVTVVHEDWTRDGEGLLQSDPRKLIAAFKQHLLRHGAQNATGWLIGFVHGDFDPDTRQYQLHLHLVAAEGMLNVLRRLKTSSKFRSERPEGRKSGTVYQKVHFRRMLDNVPYTLTYRFQSYWPKKITVNIGDSENPRMVRRKGRGRIPEPYHVLSLLWLDKWRLQDLVLLMKLSVTTKGLTRSNSANPCNRIMVR